MQTPSQDTSPCDQGSSRGALPDSERQERGLLPSYKSEVLEQFVISVEESLAGLAQIEPGFCSIRQLWLSQDVFGSF